ncbi:MAG TPA: class I SAM-dependent methyltransferase [Candidatus Binataceae bacterium]|nr:class I SAM-dependent methyltransferase [Candidatus Binataceae bacterium]
MAPPDNPQAGLKTAEYFGKLADTYGSGEYYRKRREAALAEIRRELGKIESLLDLGCGNGTYLAAFKESIGPRLIAGGDLSLEMLRQARRRLGGSSSAMLVSCDATALPFRAGCWQSVFCSHVLQFVTDLPRCFSEIGRCLTPAGVLTVAGGELGTRERLRLVIGDARWAVFRDSLPRPRDVRVHRDLADYRRAAETAGFHVESRKVDFMATWADVAEFYRVRWLPLIDSSSRAMLSDILADITVERGTDQIELAESLLFCRKANQARH